MDKVVDIEWMAAQRLFHQLPVDDVLFFGIFILFGISFSLRGIAWNKQDPYHHVWFEKPQGTSSDVKETKTRDIGKKLEQIVSKIV
jgi:NADPH-ferrihemoprotein reductase